METAFLRKAFSAPQLGVDIDVARGDAQGAGLHGPLDDRAHLRELRIGRLALLARVPAEKTSLVPAFPCVCPEPVLVN